MYIMRSVLNTAFVVAVCIQIVLSSTSTKLMWFTTKFPKKDITSCRYIRNL